MKLGVCLVFMAAFLAAPASASAPTLGGLQRQITALKGQLVVQQAGLKMLTATEARDNDTNVCRIALQEDTINSIWHTLNLLAQYDGFQAQPDLPRYDDKGSCARVGVSR